MFAKSAQIGRNSSKKSISAQVGSAIEATKVTSELTLDLAIKPRNVPIRFFTRQMSLIGDRNIY